MPTNLIRRPKGAVVQPRRASRSDEQRSVCLDVGKHKFIADLHATQTADLIWRALPIYTVGETWGACLHFEMPVRAGRDRTARLFARPGDLYFWADDHRVLLAWGATPISKSGEIRLMRPCNVWATCREDPSPLAGFVPGAKVSLQRTSS